MPTYISTGGFFSEDGNGNTLDAGTTVLELNVAPGTTFSYTLFPSNPGELPEADITPSGNVTVTVNGEPFTDNPNNTIYIGNIVWGNGNQSQIMIFSIENPDGSIQEHIFRLGGNTFPVLSSAQDFDDLNASITGVGPITSGPFAPNTPFSPASFPEVTVINTATLNGTAGNNFLEGNAGDNVINGGDGNDSILGRDGNDVLHGGDGNDNIAGSDGDDLVFGGAGNDQLGGGNGADQLFGGSGNDIMGSGSQNDYLEAGEGNDTMSGGYGADTLYGGNGDDQMAGSFGSNDYLYGGDGNDDMGGGAGRDFLYAGAGDDRVGAGDQDDLVYGGTGNDFLGGGSGDDTLYGETGNDTLNGGSGDDLLTGGVGADQFVFNNLIAGEHDIITDFQDGLDLIRIHGAGGGFGTLTITAIAGGTLITVGDHEIEVQGVGTGAFDGGDFIFI